MLSDTRSWKFFSGLTTTFLLAAMGIAVHHTRWYAGANPTELVGWVFLVTASTMGLAVLTVQTYGPTDLRLQRVTYACIASLGVLVAIVPYWAIKEAMTAQMMMSKTTVFHSLLGAVLAGAFLSALVTVAVVEVADDADSGENDRNS